MCRRNPREHSVALVFLIGLCAVACQEEPVLTPVQRLQEAGSNSSELLGHVLHAAGSAQYARGIQLADSLVRMAPELPQAYYERGLLLIQLHQLEAADRDLLRAVELDKYHRGGWYQRGHIAFEQRDYQRAIALYKQQQEVIEDSPAALRTFYKQVDEMALPQTWLQIGRAYQLMHYADSARLAYFQVLELDSTRALAHAWLAELYKEDGDTDGAMHHYQRAWNYGKGNPDFAYEISMLHFENGNLNEALPILEYVVKAQPWNASAHYNLGRSLVGLGQVEEGQRHLDMTDQLQDLNQSIEYARAAVAQYPDEPARWRQLAQLLGQAGRVQEEQQTRNIIQGLQEYRRN